MKLTDSIKQAVGQRNAFDLSFDGVFSQSWGDVVPVVCKEMVPGDSFTCDVTAFTRLAPLASPTYGRIHGFINYFFVPNRILVEDKLWENFIRGGVDGNHTYSLPITHAGHLYLMDKHWSDSQFQSFPHKQVRKLCSYLHMGDITSYSESSPFEISLLPFAAYNRIYGDYFFPWGLEDDTDAEELYFKRLTAGYHPLVVNNHPNSQI